MIWILGVIQFVIVLHSWKLHRDMKNLHEVCRICLESTMAIRKEYPLMEDIQKLTKEDAAAKSARRAKQIPRKESGA